MEGRHKGKAVGRLHPPLLGEALEEKMKQLRLVSEAWSWRKG